MSRTLDDFRLATIEQLEAHYGGPPVVTAMAKELDHISDHYREFIEKSPFVLVATSGEEGLDCSPRGDPPGFCQVEDSTTVLLPDRPGNNRLDSLRNIIVDPRISLLFLIPGVGETIRINGTAEISIDPELLERFKMKGKLPRSVVRVTAHRVYFQCQKALVRSRLWKGDSQIERSELPSTGTILAALADELDGEQYDRDYPQRLKNTIY